MQFSATTWICPILGLALVVISACTSSSEPKSGEAAANGPGGHVDIMCIGDRINNPPESFHYSYKYSDASDSTQKDADITPQVMDITIKDKSGSHSFHGVHSNEASWSSAVVDLSNFNMTAMSSRLNSIDNTSAIVRQTQESMNGYDTSRYSIDTANANSSDRRKFETLFGTGSFEKGAAWVPADGCAVKLILDEAVQINGSLKNAHYEIERIKK
ncbi:MAG TPA: hypothetical protein VIW67_08300 [Terriglobales bacterium]|jgi:hypothetical protein